MIRPGLGLCRLGVGQLKLTGSGCGLESPGISFRLRPSGCLGDGERPGASARISNACPTVHRPARVFAESENRILGSAKGRPLARDATQSY